MSPADKNGLGNGTTQFTRTYNSGAAVALTAPATANGNTFQKWQKNGVDAATTQGVTLTMNANTTMTAVYGTSSTGGGTGGTTGGISNANGVTVLASNDLGMHCTCPEFDYVTVLPPFNYAQGAGIRQGQRAPDIHELSGHLFGPGKHRRDPEGGPLLSELDEERAEAVPGLQPDQCSGTNPGAYRRDAQRDHDTQPVRVL